MEEESQNLDAFKATNFADFADFPGKIINQGTKVFSQFDLENTDFDTGSSITDYLCVNVK